jgi:hypothetical protein
VSGALGTLARLIADLTTETVRAVEVETADAKPRAEWAERLVASFTLVDTRKRFVDQVFAASASTNGGTKASAGPRESTAQDGIEFF